MALTTVFDLARNGYRVGWFPAFGLPFVCIGVLVASRPALTQRLLSGGPQGRARVVWGWSMTLFASLWTLSAFTLTYTGYLRAVAALEHGQGAVVQGRVTDFVPMPAAGHADESFCVARRCFSYSDYAVTSGFRNTASHGGPMRDGLFVRITYVGNLILRLQIEE